jgi:hypothetical protein
MRDICRIEIITEIAQKVQQRHNDGSSFEKEWTNHHGLDRCDCDELVQFIKDLI